MYDLKREAGEDTLFNGGSKLNAADAFKTLMRERHRVVGKVSDDIDRNNFNTAIAAIMELVNSTNDFLRAAGAEERAANAEWAAGCDEVAEVIVKLLAPFAPHWAEELWTTVLGNEPSIHNQPWPEFDPEKAKPMRLSLLCKSTAR